MSISAINPQAAQQAAFASPVAPRVQKPSGDPRVGKACEEFEAVLWRQMVEKALTPMLEESGAGADPTGTVNYLISDAIAGSVSKGSRGLASVLQLQLSGNHPTSPKP
jgi:hypothetical protein